MVFCQYMLCLIIKTKWATFKFDIFRQLKNITKNILHDCVNMQMLLQLLHKIFELLNFTFHNESKDYYKALQEYQLFYHMILELSRIFSPRINRKLDWILLQYQCIHQKQCIAMFKQFLRVIFTVLTIFIRKNLHLWKF
jgi:hypothetical protein